MFRSRRHSAVTISATLACAAALTLTLACSPCPATAQTKPNEAAKPAAQTPSKTSADRHLVTPDPQGLAILIQNSLIALNHANLTGNYSVLRDLAAPGFQNVNSTKKLAAVFANMRARNLNLSPIVLYQPKLIRQPAIDDKGFLRTTGFYETQPLQIHFDLVFQPVAGVWRLFEISVWTAAVPQAPP